MLTEEQLVPYFQAQKIRDETSQLFYWWDNFLNDNPEVPKKIQDHMYDLLHEIAKFNHVIDPQRDDFKRLLK